MSDSCDGCELGVLVIAPEAPGLPQLQWLAELGGLAAVKGVRLDLVGGPQATASAVAQGLQARHDVVIWSGHGEPNELLLADGSTVDGDWLATQVRCGAPRMLVLAACGSGVKDEALESLASTISRNGINVIGMPLRAEDRGAISYNIELVRALVAGADVWTAHRVATKRVARDFPELAAGTFLTPGLTNGYRAIVERIDAQDKRFDRIEAQLQMLCEFLGMGDGQPARRRTATARR